MFLYVLGIAFLRAEQERDAIVGYCDHQRAAVRANALDAPAAKPVNQNNRINLWICLGLGDAFLESLPEKIRGVVKALLDDLD